MHSSEKSTSGNGQNEHAFQHIVSIECSIDDISTINELDRSSSKRSPSRAKLIVGQQADIAGNAAKADAAKEEQRIYRIDHQACKFQPSRLLTEPQIHVSVKSNPAAKAVDIEQIVHHKKAVRISQGAEVQQIVVSPYESIDSDDLHLSLDEEPINELTTDLSEFSSHNTVVSDQPVNLQVELSERPAESSVDHLITGESLGLKVEDASEEKSQATDSNANSASLESNNDNEEDSIESFAKTELKPAWAVNSFRWPDTITRLCTHHKSAFERLVQSLHLNVNREAARIGVIHSRAGQGSTTLATCLANVLASSNAKVLLADMDLENPDLEEVANIKLKYGWQQLLEVDQSVNEFLVRDSSSNITLMPLRREAGLENSRPGLLRTIKTVAPTLASHFDFSVYDIGNVRNLMIDENCHVGFLDGAVIVSDSSGNESSAVAIYEKLIAAGVPAVVIAENFRSKARSAA